MSFQTFQNGYEVQEKVMDITIAHRDIIVSQDIEEYDTDLKPSNQSQQFNSSTYYDKEMKKVQEKKFDMEVNRRLGQLTRDCLGVSILNTSAKDLLRTAFQNNNNISIKIEEPQIKLHTFDQINIKSRKTNKKIQAKEAMASLIEARQLGTKNYDGRPTKLLDDRNDSNRRLLNEIDNITVTDRTTLFAMLPQKQKIPKQIVEVPDQKIHQTPERPQLQIFYGIKKLSQEFTLESLLVLVEQIDFIPPIMFCCGTTQRTGQRVEFVYRPGFDSSLQRNELTESVLDFEYAIKPEVGMWYNLFYRTHNSQNQIVVERIEKQL